MAPTESCKEWMPLWLMGPTLAIATTLLLIGVAWVAAYFKIL